MEKKEEIIKIRVELATSGNIVIERAEGKDYYVMEWKDGHYELDDVLIECKEVIQAIEDFKKKYLN